MRFGKPVRELLFQVWVLTVFFHFLVRYSFNITSACGSWLINLSYWLFFHSMNHWDKRKRTSEEDQQPPLKKIATDGPLSEVATNSFPSHIQEETALVASGDTKVGPSSSFKKPDETVSDHRGKRDKGDDQSMKTAAILSQVWREDLNSGKLLISLFEQFGEGILSFMPTPETSLFLWMLVLKLVQM